MRRLRAIGPFLALALWLTSGAANAQDLGLGDLDDTAEPDEASEEAADDEAATDGAADDETASDAPAAPASGVERAREEFAAGIACIEQHETRCAVDHFRTALRLHDAPAIRYNLASALFEIREYPEAAHHVARVLRDEETPEELREHTETLEGQLREQGGTIAITVSGSTEGTEVAVDGFTIPEAERGAVIAAPGTRAVILTRGGQEIAREEVEVTAGGEATVALVAVPTPEEVAAQNAVEEPVETRAPELYEDWPFWAIVGGGVAVVAAIVVIAVVVASNPSVDQPIGGNYEPGTLRWE